MAFLAVAADPAAPGPQKAPPPSPFGDMTVEALAGTLRGQIIRWLPNPLYEASPGWGKTDRVFTGLRWTGKGLAVHAEPKYGLRKDGTWKKIRVTADDLAETLVFDIRKVRQPKPGRVLMDVFLSFNVKVYYKHQVWESGIKLYDGHLEVKLRLKLSLKIEIASRLEDKGGLIPDAVFRLRVVQSDLRWDNVTVEHVAGLGGDAAEILGDVARYTLRRLDPDLDDELRAKANAAIIKAGDTKEVRLSMSRLLGSKGGLPLLPGQLFKEPK